MRLPVSRAPSRYIASGLQGGFSLVELMIAMTIGLVISAALATLFGQLSTANREQFKASMQIENGRYTTDLLASELRHAGFYGEFAMLPPAAATLPDPCTVPAEGNVNSTTADHPLAFYVQGYPAASLTASALGGRSPGSVAAVTARLFRRRGRPL